MAEPTHIPGRSPLQAGETVHPKPALAGDGLPTGKSASPEPSYYDISLLKPPVWKWEIAGYFFFGGVSGGACILARLAERHGGSSARDLRSAATWTAFIALLPCAPLLIRDLGDPRRFHYMLRLFKPSSPMSFGTWILTSFSGVSTLAALRELPAPASTAVALARHPALRPVLDLAGIPLALLLVGYTGVLLSCTANPLWCKSIWLGPLFTASAMGNAASAVSLALEWRGSREWKSKKFLTRVATVSHAAETVSLAAYHAERGPLAQPLKTGKYKTMIRLATAAVLASEVLKRLPLKGRAKTAASIAGSVAALGAGLLLRTAIVYAGQDAANDPRLARRATAPDPPGNTPPAGNPPRSP